MMRTGRLWVFELVLTLIVLMLVGTAVPEVALAQQAAKIRWDITRHPSWEPYTPTSGGVAFASATDGTFMKLTGTGVFGPLISDPVTGGGTWETFTVSRKSMGKGTYTVTGLVSWEEAPGAAMPAEWVDQIGANANARSGLAVLRVAYKNADGNPAGTGILIVSCHLAGAPDSIFEGVVVVKGTTTFYDRALTMPLVDANRTVFHRQ